MFIVCPQVGLLEASMVDSPVLTVIEETVYARKPQESRGELVIEDRERDVLKTRTGR